MKTLNFITLLLIIIGGLNWGLTAFGLNIVHALFKSIPIVETVIYVLVAASAVFQIKNLKA